MLVDGHGHRVTIQPGWYPPPQPYQPLPLPVPRDPFTGRPYSAKSRTTVMLLQGLLGLFCIGGVGRLYAGHVGLGLVQLFAGVVLWVAAICGAVLILPLFLPALGAVWFVVDGALTTADGGGYPLRP